MVGNSYISDVVVELKGCGGLLSVAGCCLAPYFSYFRLHVYVFLVFVQGLNSMALMGFWLLGFLVCAIGWVSFVGGVG